MQTTAPRIFISYARSDGEDFAKDLRQKLEKEGFSLCQDRTQMEGGKDWWDQIVRSLTRVELLVLVLTHVKGRLYSMRIHPMSEQW